MDINAFFQDFEKLLAQGRHEDALPFLQGVIASAEAENDNHALVTVLNEAAGYLRNTGRCGQAVQAGERALLLLRNMGYEHSDSYGTTLLNTATAYRAAGDSSKAMEMFIASLALLGASLPEDDVRLAALYNNISSIHEERGEWSKAFEALLKAASIMEKKPDMLTDAAIVLTNSGMILFRLDRAEEALAALENAVALFRRDAEQTGGRPAPHYAAALAGLGEACFRMGQFAGAAQNYEAALEHIAFAFGENRDYAVTCRNCADAFAAAGDEKNASRMAAKADAVSKQLGLD